MKKINYYTRQFLLVCVLALTVPFGVFADTIPSDQTLVLSGEAIYRQSCLVCHGDDGEGSMPGVPDLTSRAGVMSQTDSILAKKIEEGFQSPGSLMAMPAKGGNPDLNTADILRVLSYLRQAFQ
jgi:mono/diheme cytochrome c family protein